MDEREMWAELWAICQAQDGLVTVEQALEVGLSPRQLKTARGRDRIETIRKGVLGPPGVPATARRALRAAILGIADSAGSHSSAALMLEMPPTGDERTHLSVPRQGSAQAVGVVLHRVPPIPPSHLVVIDGMPITSRARTLVDLAAWTHPKRWEHLFDEELAAHRGLIEDVEAVAEVWCRRGRKGSRLVAEALAHRIGGPVIPPTILEGKLYALLEEAGLPLPVQQPNLPFLDGADDRVDAAYPDLRLVIEADSRRWHTRLEDFEEDRRRDQLAAAAGWKVLRFTWRQITEEPEHVVATVRAVLDAQRALLHPHRS